MKQRIAGGIGYSRTPLVVLGAIWLLVAVVISIYWLVDSPGIEVRWQTETEFDTAGFNVLRGKSDDGPFSQINDRLITSADDPAAGADYLLVDSDVVSGETYYYRLEDVEFDGDTTQHALISARASGRPPLLLVLGVALATIGITMMFFVGRKTSPRLTDDAELDT